MNSLRMNRNIATRSGARYARPAALVAFASTVATVLLLVSLHVLSPEFSPAWRMVSEYALGHYGFVLAIMFLVWGVSSWALALALWSEVPTRAGKVGVWVLVIAGLGEALAAIFDITQATGHTIAGVLGVGGFPVAAVLLSVSLGHAPAWRGAQRLLLWLAHLSWISIVLLGATLVLMTVQAAQAYGGQLPQQAPTHLPAGVLGLDGWADRLFVLVACAWVLVTAWQTMKLHSTNHPRDVHAGIHAARSESSADTEANAVATR